MNRGRPSSYRLYGPPHVLELPSVLTEVVGHYEHACPVCQGCYQEVTPEYVVLAATAAARRCYSER